ncbi:MAG: hypothetical protein JNM45_00830 [Rhizobiales bacterium]|nr:hypothetical protein [Hyphomicrobiales bacterium]
MPKIQTRSTMKALPAPARRVLYVGPAADEVCSIVTRHVGEIDVRYESNVQQALELARGMKPDTIIIDQRDERLATKLIVPLFANMGYPVRLVVVSALSDVSQYLSVPGVARVLTAPIREGQLLRVIGLPYRAPRVPRGRVAPDPPVAAGGRVDRPRVGVVQIFFNHLMTLVSALYKRAAFLLLLALFCAFSFYALLIGYFLLSSSWGAPMSLSRGHEMVNKIEGDLTELRVALSKTDQELAENGMAKVKASRALDDAQLLVSYSLGTVGKELKSSDRKRKTLNTNIKRMTRVRDTMKAQIEHGGMEASLKELYSKRLIDKKTYNASTLGLVEASQRLAGLDGDLDDMKEQLAGLDSRDELLTSLQQSLEKGGPITSMVAANSDLMLLVKQSVDATTARDLATSTLSTVAVKEKQLKDSAAVLKLQISQVESSALARAINGRVDVVFIPYANLASFQPGTPLYSCALTLFWCTQAGFVGDPQPGEFTSVHPFFGKPIRGIFVEAKLAKPVAATREIIHGKRAPFFF